MAELIDRLKDSLTPSPRRKGGRSRRVAPPAKLRQTRAEPRPQPPVMVRGTLMGAPLAARKSAKSKARRRYDLTLSVPGAEMRLPALPAVSLGPRLVSAVLVLALAILLYYLWSAPAFQVETVSISGLQRLTKNDVNIVLDVAGEPIFSLSGKELEEKLRAAFPEFSSVSVEIGFPRQVVVKVVERQPILTWKQGDRTILVDANGVTFPQRNPAEMGPALTVEASSPPPVVADPALLAGGETLAVESVPFIPVEMVSAILSISAIAPANTPLIYSEEHGLGWKDAQGWDVYFGDVRDMDMKLRVYQSLVKELKKEKIQPVLISVEYVHTPYYRLEP